MTKAKKLRSYVDIINEEVEYLIDKHDYLVEDAITVVELALIMKEQEREEKEVKN